MSKKLITILLIGLTTGLVFSWLSGVVYAASFEIGDIIKTTENLNVRTNPSVASPEISDTDYLGYAPAGTLGEIKEGPIFEDNYTWWKIIYDNWQYEGWSVENYLEEVSETLSVRLSANPSSGAQFLNNVELTAEILGTAQGTINYTFYCNRSDDGTNITLPYDYKKDGTFDNPLTIIDICDYSSPGTYTAKVIVERGSLAREARTEIIVKPEEEPDLPIPLPPQPTCSDGIQNQDETDVDCGGVCPACPVPPSPGGTGVPYPVDPWAEALYVPNNYPTIQEAVDAANPGDTIIVRDGIYIENININKDHLTIKSENGADSTIVQAANSDDHVFEVVESFIEIDGFTVKGATDIEFSGVFLSGANYCDILNNNITDNGRGILIADSSRNSIVENIISHNKNDGIGFFSSGTGNHFIGNVIEWNNGRGINLFSFLSPTNNIISHNTVSHNTDSGIVVFSTPLDSGNIIDFNTIYSNGIYGLYLNASSDNLLMSNTVSDNKYGIYLDTSSYNAIRDNLVSANHIGLYVYSSDYNRIYFNTLNDNIEDVYSLNSENIWNFQNQITYTFKGDSYINYLGNHFSGYTDVDVNGNGVWDNPFNFSTDRDNYPLVLPFENYTDISYEGMLCGNTLVEKGEECDDGYRGSDECTKDCKLVNIECGDSICSDGEICEVDCGVSKEPTCSIELQKNGVEIDEINVGEFFDIVFSDYSGDIKEVRFLSDELQNGEADDGFEWTDPPYNWNASSGDWDAETKIKKWSFSTDGDKEVWAEVIDGNNNASTCSANISATENVDAPQCSDGIDNDGDGEIDEEDYGCLLNHPLLSEPREIEDQVQSFVTQFEIDIEKVSSYYENDLLPLVDNLINTQSALREDVVQSFASIVLDSLLFAVDIEGLSDQAKESISVGSSLSDDVYDEIMGYISEVQDMDLKVYLVGELLKIQHQELTEEVALKVAHLVLEALVEKGLSVVDKELWGDNIMQILVLIKDMLWEESADIETEIKQQLQDYINKLGNLREEVHSMVYSISFTIEQLEYYEKDFSARKLAAVLMNNYFKVYSSTPINYEDLSDYDRNHWTTISGDWTFIISSAMLKAIWAPVNGLFIVVDGLELVTDTKIMTDQFCMALRARGTLEILLSDEIDFDMFPQNLDGIMFANMQSGVTTLRAGEVPDSDNSNKVDGTITVSKLGDNKVKVVVKNTGHVSADYKVLADTATHIVTSALILHVFEKEYYISDAFVEPVDTWKTLSSGESWEMVLDIPYLKTQDILDFRLIAKHNLALYGIDSNYIIGEGEIKIFGGLLGVIIGSPGELRVYDSLGNVTGLIDGKVVEKIPDSVYNKENHSVVIFDPLDIDSYRYEVVGTDEGIYDLTITSVEDKEAITFSAVDIPTYIEENHQYSIDWQALSQGEKGVTLRIDADGDGEFEQIITSDSELTQDEFILQTETIIDCDPDTLNLKSKGKWITCYIELPEGYDVKQIDGLTVFLNEIPVYFGKQGWAKVGGNEYNIFDYDGDGILERMVKFDSQAVQENLEIGENIEMVVTGEVSHNQGLVDFKGSDIIRVINKDGKSK